MHLGPLRHRDAGQGLHRHDIGQVVGRPGQVVHPVGVGDELVPGLAFADLFHPPVVVADVHVQPGDLFAVQGERYSAAGRGCCTWWGPIFSTSSSRPVRDGS